MSNYSFKCESILFGDFVNFLFKVELTCQVVIRPLKRTTQV